MAKNSPIEWTKHTANLWHGCTKVHEGCDNCYAAALSKRYGHDIWGNDRPRKQIRSVWEDLRNYQKEAKAANEIHRVFVGSMMDIFEKPMPIIDHLDNQHEHTTGDIRQKFFDNISVGRYPNLVFLLLTKRPGNINKYIPEEWKQNPPANVMFGTSPVNQATANTLIAQLIQVNGKRFLSAEPQLDEITLLPWLQDKSIHWVIQGGESGPHKRPFNTDWARKMLAECTATNTPYFFKQIDKVQPIPADLMVRQFP
jgi:protein gp37